MLRAGPAVLFSIFGVVKVGSGRLRLLDPSFAH